MHKKKLQGPTLEGGADRYQIAGTYTIYTPHRAF